MDLSDPELDQEAQHGDRGPFRAGARTVRARMSRTRARALASASGFTHRVGRRRIAIIVAYIMAILVAAPLWIYPAIPPAFVRSAAGPTPSPVGTTIAEPSPLTYPVPSQSMSLQQVASDDFERSVPVGWGAAVVGGPYVEAEGLPIVWSVSGGAGHAVLPAAASRWGASLSGVAARDVQIGWSLSADRMPGDGALFVYAELRRADDGRAYRLGVRISSDGTYAHAGLVIDERETSLGPDVLVASLAYAPGMVIMVRAQATGVDPTMIGVRVWAQGQPEPQDWLFNAIDWAGSLQVAGAVGVGSYLGARLTNAPIALVFDDLVATTTDAPLGSVEQEAR